MARHHLLGRIHQALQGGTYLTPTASVPTAQREALDEVRRLLDGPAADPDAARIRIQQLHASGRIDRVVKLSALGVVAAHPAVRDYAEAARLAGQQEIVALDAGGDGLPPRLASADRHRGVLAFLLGRYEVALTWFTSALERERSAENLCNVLSALLRLGDLEEARDLLSQVRCAFPAAVQVEVEETIERDEDLAALRAR
jgi:tetratricopeptide (TPR) repeat protein